VIMPKTPGMTPDMCRGSRGLDAGPMRCSISEKAGPSSEEFTREGLSRGAPVLGTRSGWASMAQLTRPAAP